MFFQCSFHPGAAALVPAALPGIPFIELLVADKGVQPIQLPAAQDRSQQDGQQHKVKRQRRQKERTELFGVQKNRRGDQNVADGRRRDQRDLDDRDERCERIAQAVPEWIHGASVDENRAGAG